MKKMDSPKVGFMRMEDTDVLEQFKKLTMKMSNIEEKLEENKRKDDRSNNCSRD